MMRDGQWYSYDTENQWLSFDALKVVHKVTPVAQGERYSSHLVHTWKVGPFDSTRLGYSSQSRLFPSTCTSLCQLGCEDSPLHHM